MSDIHIDDFYKDAAKILLQLYAVFPRMAAVYVEDISGPDQPDEYGVPDDRFMACFSTMIWLADENYIRYVDTIRQEAIDQATLTEKGFIMLCSRSSLTQEPALQPVTDTTEPDVSLPSSIRIQTQTNIHLLRTALKSASSSEIRRILQHMLFNQTG